MDKHFAVKAKPLPTHQRQRISVNSFGIGGSNAHALIEQWDDRRYPLPKEAVPGPRLLLFSGGTEAALLKTIEQHQGYLHKHPGRLDDMAYTLASRREWLGYRAYAIAEAGTTGFSATQPVKRPLSRHPVIMVFSGQGAHWAGMGKELIRSHAVFRQALQDMDDMLQSLPHAPTWHIVGPLYL